MTAPDEVVFLLDVDNTLLKEPLINSGLDGWRDEMFRIKAKSAGNSVLLPRFSTPSRDISAARHRFMN